MKYIFFDTETNGLPKNWQASAEDVDNWPRVIQLAWALYDDDGLIEKRVDLIKPNGWVVPLDPFWIEHGFSTEKNMAEGIPMEEALSDFVAVRLTVDFSIAHNIAFDSKILRAEMIRLGMIYEFSSKKICTMTSSTTFCKLPNPNGRKGYKWPKLIELYDVLFKEEMVDAHDAMGDVTALAKCFFALKEKGIIQC
jgi:DNA polymerase III epsilon subunit-like protein